MTPKLAIAGALPNAGGVAATAAAVAVAAGALRGEEGRSGVLVVEVATERLRGPTLLAAAGARRLERSLRDAGIAAAARGGVCWAGVEASGDEGLEQLRAALRAAEEWASAAIACLPPGLWRPALEDERLRVAGGMLRARLPEQRALAALATRELIAAGARARIVARPPGAVAARRALAGLDPGGSSAASARRLAAGLLGPRPARPAVGRDGAAGPDRDHEVGAGSRLRLPVRPPVDGAGEAAEREAGAARPGGERGQALPLLLGGAVGLVICALLLVAIGGAVTGTARGQRIADLVAISAARSMRDDQPRLFAPAELPSGRANPRHLGRERYLERAAAAAREAADRNGADPARLRVRFPDRGSFAPLRVRVEVLGSLHPRLAPGDAGERAGPAGERAAGGRGGGEPGVADADTDRDVRVEASAEATAAPVAGTEAGDPPGSSSPGAGDYAGPLARRQGRPMRPDVARAFDRLAAAARAAGLELIVSSAYRTSAEQARLFAANPDPRWVAPPGRSLHRCGTELDLGPPSTHAWLAANAPAFGFVRRYAWEPWHYGFARGPAPCSAPAVPAREGDGRGASTMLPAYVPARFRPAIAGAASRHDVSASLLAAQLLAESNFNPFAVSSAGARGIAQFMPATAAAYGLDDPFDAEASIGAQARLMADLLDRFGSVSLALAAYNAGPVPVAACGCVPAYPETQGYVARILGLLGGAGEIAPATLEVRLVD